MVAVPQKESQQVQVRVEKKPGCQVSFQISVTPEAVTACYKQALKAINRSVVMPGFRKGKAPDQVIAKNYSGYIEQEWRDLVLKTAFKEAMDITGVFPLNKGRISEHKIESISCEKGAEVALHFEAVPEVPDVDVQQLNIEPFSPKEVTQEDVDRAIESLRLYYAEWDSVEGRPVKADDYVELDIVNANDGEKYCEKMRFKVDKEHMAPWLSQLIIGYHAGESLEAMSEKPLEGPDNEEEFIPTLCKVTILSLLEPKFPEMNEPFLTKLGVKTFEQLRERVTADLVKKEQENVRVKQRDLLEKQLLEKYPFDIPASLVKAEKEHRLERAKKAVAEQEGNEEVNDKKIDEALRLFLLTKKIAERQQLSVSQEELMREVLGRLMVRDPEAGASGNSEDYRSRLYWRLIARKAKDFLIDKILVA